MRVQKVDQFDIFSHLWCFQTGSNTEVYRGRVAQKGTALNGPQLTLYMHYTFTH